MITAAFRAALHRPDMHQHRSWEARKRIAWAVAASAAVHLWIADGVPTDAPHAPAPSPAPMLAVRLEHVRSTPEARDVVAGTDTVNVIEKLPEVVVLPRSARLPPPPADLPGGERPRLPGDDAPRPERNRALPPTADPVYYPARELDVYPSPTVPLRFDYPAHLLHAQLAGSVLVSLKVDEAGAVDEAAVIGANPPGQFDEHTRAVLAATRFNPARRAGRAVKSQVIMRVDYDPAMREGAMR